MTMSNNMNNGFNRLGSAEAGEPSHNSLSRSRSGDKYGSNSSLAGLVANANTTPRSTSHHLFKFKEAQSL